MLLDFKKAFLYADIDREVYIELPDDDGDRRNRSRESRRRRLQRFSARAALGKPGRQPNGLPGRNHGKCSLPCGVRFEPGVEELMRPKEVARGGHLLGRCDLCRDLCQSLHTLVHRRVAALDRDLSPNVHDRGLRRNATWLPAWPQS